jgi:branched-chain amino acid transport system ATP-binding protein
VSLLDVDRITAGYGARDEILKGVGLEIAAGEIVAILGPNGAGKSTLLKAIAGLVSPRSGSIELMGVSILGLPPREISRRGVAFVPQEANIFPSLTVEENLDIGGYLDPAECRARLERVYLQMPEMAARRSVKARTLSGGQRQLLAMGMALMVGPKLMLLDEPSAGLSPIAADKLFAMIEAIRGEGIAVAMVEQNALRALGLADRAYILVDGRNARQGSSAELREDAEMRRIFFGQA